MHAKVPETRQHMPIHAQLSICANIWRFQLGTWMFSYKQSLLYVPFNVAGAIILAHVVTWSCIPCSWRVRTRADTRSQCRSTHAESWPILDECQHMQVLSQPLILLTLRLNMNHHMQVLAQLSISTNTCGRHAQLTHEGTHSAPGRHMLKQALLLIRAETCRNMLSSWYLPTYEDTYPALDMCQHMQNFETRSTLHTNQQKQTNLQLLIKAKNAMSSIQASKKCRYTLSYVCVWIPAIVCRYIHSPWCLQTQADTWHDQALKLWKHTQIHASSWYRSTHKESWQNLQKRWHMHILAELLILAHTWWYELTHEGTCQALNTCRNMCTHAQLLIVKIPGQLLIDADRFRKGPDSQ